MCSVKLKRCLATFAIVLVTFSASLLPCYAAVDVSTDDISEGQVAVGLYQWSQSAVADGDTFIAPVVGVYFASTGMYGSSSQMPCVPCFNTRSQFVFTGDKTLYWSVYPMFGSDLTGRTVAFNDTASTTYLPDFKVGRGYVSGESTSIETLDVTRVVTGNHNYQNIYAPTYRVTIPAVNASGQPFLNFQCIYPGTDLGNVQNECLWFSVGDNSDNLLFYVVDCFQFIDTGDTAILAAIDQILEKVSNIDVNVNNILAACNDILVQLQSLNADTDTIITLLQSLESLSTSQLTQLENISSSVDAIYYFLTQEMKSESDKLSGEAAEVGSQIDNSAQAENYYQTSMQGSYDSLDLDNFSFGGIAGAMELVGTVFSDMWSAWGEYTILFTYPMILGVALLVIGRISKHGGGNSSRSSEHKGGEGGA